MGKKNKNAMNSKTTIEKVRNFVEPEFTTNVGLMNLAMGKLIALVMVTLTAKEFIVEIVKNICNTVKVSVLKTNIPVINESTSVLPMIIIFVSFMIVCMIYVFIFYKSMNAIAEKNDRKEL